MSCVTFALQFSIMINREKIDDVLKALRMRSSPMRADSSAWFFKTAKGQYGYGDKFIGVNVPDQRKVAKMFKDLPLKEIDKLLKSPIHECRLTALIILVGQFKALQKAISRGDLKSAETAKMVGGTSLSTTYRKASRKLTNLHRGGKVPGRFTDHKTIFSREIVDFYLAHTDRINNWDLVDSSASYILGAYLAHRPMAERKIIYKLAKSQNLWERRIAIVASGEFIRHHDFGDTMAIAKLLLRDEHDLIHKAVGWMLREIGKRSKPTLLKFLDENAANMPRTALRYSIEHFSPEEKGRYMRGVGLRKM